MRETADDRTSGHIFPDYRGGSLVNLMASIMTACDGAASDVEPTYPEASLLPASRLAERPKLVLFIIDGLGYDFLAREGGGGVLLEHLRGALTSVFPSTTASAVTTFLTGRAPQQHAVTGWFMWLEELGSVTAALPFRPRGNRTTFPAPADPRSIFDSTSLFDRIPIESHIVYPHPLTDTDYSRAHRGAATVHGYDGVEHCMQVVAGLLRAEGQRLIVAYWPELDRLAHARGIGSEAVRALLRRLDRSFERFIHQVQGTDATLVVTADHGFVDSHPDRRVHLDEHPTLTRLLRLPLCGEPRVAYCYVRPGAELEFEAYVGERLAHCARLIEPGPMISAGYFGLGAPHPRLGQRIGDYALIMKDDYVIVDRVAGEERGHAQVGVHGGMSAAEMRVPLVVAQC